jgi:RimJ/RimL family protein N-acetyltransferase/L-amino acid N-acyltransferase YncA
MLAAVPDSIPATLSQEQGTIMMTIFLRPADPGRDFGQLAAWLSLLENETATELGLQEYYQKQEERITQRVAVDEQGELLGFYWAVRDRIQSQRVSFFLFVKPEQRGQGIGRRLYAHFARTMQAAQADKLRVNIRDVSPQDRAFAERRGYLEQAHSIAMVLNLDAFDDRPYDAIIARLQSEGFQFTSMEASGNTEEAQRLLYHLNATTAMETLGGDGSPFWASFEDFQQSVCRSDGYRPAAQMVAIDTAGGDWAAMSAISRIDDYAYNLHTGVARRYRGRQLAQAVKVRALRYARDVLRVHTVRTHHGSKNLPMIAIDRKLGYVQVPGTVSMEKTLLVSTHLSSEPSDRSVPSPGCRPIGRRLVPPPMPT